MENVLTAACNKYSRLLVSACCDDLSVVALDTVKHYILAAS